MKNDEGVPPLRMRAGWSNGKLNLRRKQLERRWPATPRCRSGSKNMLQTDKAHQTFSFVVDLS